MIWMRNLRRKAQILLDELDGSCLEVVLIPSQDAECAMRGGMIRAVQSQNAEWYRKFCEEHSSNRSDSWRWSKFKTKIKRQHTRRALNELIDGKCETPYAEDLRGFIQRRKFEAWQLKEVKAA